VRRAAALARAFFVRDLVTDTTYKVSVAVEFADVIIGVAAFYYLSRVIGDRHPAGYDAFAFILVGVAMNSAMSTALACFAQAVKADQQAGTLKPILAAPLSAGAMVALSSVYPLVRSASSGVAYFAAGALLFQTTWRATNLLASAVVLAAALGAFAAVGLLSAAFALVVKRGDPLLWLFGALSWLLAGVFFPVEMLPPTLQQASRLFPLTYALDALRATLLNGAGLASVGHDLAVLSAIAVVGLPVSAVLVSAGAAWGRRTGTLGHC
jgi:ABC-2 type transport system permease protein